MNLRPDVPVVLATILLLLVPATSVLAQETPTDRCGDALAAQPAVTPEDHGFDLTKGTYTMIRTESDLSLVDDPRSVAPRLVGLQFGTVDVTAEIPLDFTGAEPSAPGHADFRLFPGDGWFRGMEGQIDDGTTEIHTLWDTQSPFIEHLSVRIVGCDDPGSALWERDLLSQSGAPGDGDRMDATATTQVDARGVDEQRNDQLTLDVHVVDPGAADVYFVQVEARLEFVFEIDDNNFGPAGPLQADRPDWQDMLALVSSDTPVRVFDTVTDSYAMGVYYLPVLPLNDTVPLVLSLLEGAEATSIDATPGHYVKAFETDTGLYLHEYVVDDALQLDGIVIDPFTLERYDVWGTVESTLNLA